MPTLSDKFWLLLGKGSQHRFQKRYNELLVVIADIGKDVKPAYTSNKIAVDKLKRSEYKAD